MSRIHPQAIVDPAASLADDVEVGPWSFIGPGVEIAAGTRVASHVVIKGPTTIGKGNRIFQFASVGEDCQDKKYNGEPTRLIIGDNNVIREGCTLHRGTVQDQGVTRIGSNNLFMAYVHVAHDCVVGDDIIMANNATIAGHVHVGDGAILGGYTTVHHGGVQGYPGVCHGERQPGQRPWYEFRGYASSRLLCRAGNSAAPCVQAGVPPRSNLERRAC